MQAQILREVVGRCRASLGKLARVTTNLSTYRDRMRLARESALAADANVRRDGHTLRESGVCRLDFPDPDMAETLSVCRTIIEERADTATRTGKGFFSQLIKSEDLWQNPVLLRTAMNPYVLDVMSACYGKLPFLESIELLVSYPNETGTLSQSQKWHIDRTDSMVVKQIIYIDDVTEDNGPFSSLPPHESAKVPFLTKHYLDDDEIARYTDLARLTRVEGATGTRMLVDTGRCYHFGSRVKRRRHALFYYYNTGFAKFARQGHWRDTPAARMDWSPLQRRVLDITGR